MAQEMVPSRVSVLKGMRMSFDSQQEIYRGRPIIDVAGTSLLRIVMLFGSVAVAIALIATQVLDSKYPDYMAQTDYPVGIDQTITGTIARKDRYTIRRSVLQDSPNSVCILRDNGTRSGDC
jgi:hypothetical protein